MFPVLAPSNRRLLRRLIGGTLQKETTMRRSLIIAVAILATMTVALVALAVEPFVDGDAISDLPSDHQPPNDHAERH